jgi:hypothetical protein
MARGPAVYPQRKAMLLAHCVTLCDAAKWGRSGLDIDGCIRSHLTQSGTSGYRGLKHPPAAQRRVSGPLGTPAALARWSRYPDRNLNG